MFVQVHLPCQIKKGSIRCRRDRRDKAEWQFALEKEVKYRATGSRHKVQASSSGKAEAAAWLKAKAEAGMLDTKEADLAEQALSEVAPAASKGKKSLLALKDKEDEDDGEGAANESGSGSRKWLLSWKVKKEKGTDSDKGKKVDQCLKSLMKLAKDGGKVNLENAKNQLFEAALAVKKVNK
eukprot:s1325_g2.t1